MRVAIRARPMHIYLIGMMGVGKSSVGRALARRLERPFVDTDALIEAACGRSIPAIFAGEGEAGFRAREAVALRTLDGMAPSVVATGGGAPCYGDNMDVLLKSGFVVWLRAAPERLCRRLRQSRTQRPLIAATPPDELRSIVEALLAQRAPCYVRAHAQVEVAGRRPAQLASDIENLLPAGVR